MDPPEQALVEVRAAPSAAVAGLVAASIAENTKRTYAAALEGQDLTDASLSIYLASLYAAGLSPAVASMAVASVKFRFRLQAGARSTGCASRPSSRSLVVGKSHQAPVALTKGGKGLLRS